MSARHRISPRGTEGAFERKVFLSKLALLFEQIWPRAWLLIGIAGLFILVYLAGIWPRLPELPHKVVLGLFGADRRVRRRGRVGRRLGEQFVTLRQRLFGPADDGQRNEKHEAREAKHWWVSVHGTTL